MTKQQHSTGQATNQLHSSTLKKRSFKGRQVQVSKGEEPPWFIEVSERAKELGVKPVRSWKR